MSKKYLSAAQVAKRLGVSTETVYNYCKRGLLGGQYIKNNKKGTWKIDLESLELLEKESTFKSSRQIKKELNYSLF